MTYEELIKNKITELEQTPGHFVMCNDKEFAEYQRKLKG